MNDRIENPLIAYIDLNAFENNINIIRKRFPDSKIILPVKANAYGHGDIIISKHAQKLNIDCLGISRISEGVKLREANIASSIMNFGVEHGKNIDLAIEYDIELSVSSLENIKEIEEKSKLNQNKLPIHLKVDTGMRRLGCLFDEVLDLAKYINNSKHLLLKSFYSHYAKSDEDNIQTQNQADLFEKAIILLERNNINPEFYHISNSGSILKPPKSKSIFAIRPGIMCYGYTPFKEKNTFDLIPVMTLTSKVIHLKKVPKNTGISYGHTYITKKPSILATVPLGYGDGFPRSLSNKFSVSINGKNYSQIGTISMDITVFEVDNDVKINDEVIIFGKKNECVNDAKDLANFIGTISYEITTSLTDRVPRIISQN